MIIIFPDSPTHSHQFEPVSPTQIDASGDGKLWSLSLKMKFRPLIFGIDPEADVHLPRHSTWPSPSNPCLHLQTYSAGRLQHSAFSTHFPASSGMVHSSISEIIRN